MSESKRSIKIFVLLISFWPSVLLAELKTVIEAETMPTKDCANGAVTTDGWNCKGPGYIAIPFEFAGGDTTFQIIAKGTFAGDAWPQMEVRIDQQVIKTLEINSEQWKTFELTHDVAAGNHEIALAFINDYYQKPDDRNLLIDKVTIFQLLSSTGKVGFAWDPSTSEGVIGYKLYYGAKSRFDPSSFDAAAITAALIAKNCTDPAPEAFEKCKKSYENYCGCIEWEPGENEDDPYVCKTQPDPPDPLCDYDWKPYDHVTDVGLVFTYSLTSLPIGKYYFALSAYDETYEGKFSIELEHEIGEIQKPTGTPARPGGFKVLANSADSMIFIRNMFEKEND